MKSLLNILVNKPSLEQENTEKFWDDPYISMNMLKAHLKEDEDGATRKRAFVQASVEWIANVLPAHQYPKLLDLGCGPGIYAELFHEKGYQVVGVDLSHRSIQYAIDSANKKRYAIDYSIKNYIEDDITGYYHLVTLIYCDFGALLKQQQNILLEKVYQALLPGGCFLFDVFTPYYYEGKSETKTWKTEENGFWSKELSLVMEATYHYGEENTFLEQYTIVNNEGIKQYLIWNHTFTLDVLKAQLTAVGFKEVLFYGDVTGIDYTNDSQTICVIAKK